MSAPPTDPSVPTRLLAWYDAHARLLPWRAPPGSPTRTDPYLVWLSEIMAQQNGVGAVAPVFSRFSARWPSFGALAEASPEEVTAAWAGLGRYARVPRLLACARAVAAEHGGRLPSDEDALLGLPGIGPYAAAAIRAIAFGLPASPIDGNVERVVSRLHALDRDPGSAAGKAALRGAVSAIASPDRPGDFAQALMDLGATVCTPRRPACGRCPLADGCRARTSGDPDAFPARGPRPPRRRLRARLFWLQAGGDVLLVRRPTGGRLAGALALPTGPWVEAGSRDRKRTGLAGAPAPARWRRVGAVTAPLSNLDVTFDVVRASLPERPDGAAGLWTPVGRVEVAGLPSAFLRAARAVLDGARRERPGGPSSRASR